MTDRSKNSPIYGDAKLRAKVRFILRDKFTEIEQQKGELTNMWGEKQFSREQLEQIVDYNPDRAALWGKRKRRSEEMKTITQGPINEK